MTRIDRRTFLTGTVGAVAGGATGLIPGIAAASQVLALDPPFQSMPLIPPKPVGRRGGKITFVHDTHGPSDTLDPTQLTSSLDYLRTRLTFNNLLRIREDLSVEPELALSFEANRDATEWTFRLRRDVEWHDGSKFTAADVVYSMNRHVGKDSKSKVKALVKSIRDWVALDRWTVRAKMSRPDVNLPRLLATFHFRIIKDGTTSFGKPVGTGPYRVKSFKPGVRSVHVRNDNYWVNGRPYVDEFETLGISDGAARLNALLAGDADMITSIPEKQLRKVASSSAVTLWSLPTGEYMDVVVRSDTGPGRDPNLALGLKYLQRRDDWLEQIHGGLGGIGNDQPIGPAYGVDHCSDLPMRPFDPDKARFHLKKLSTSSAELKVAEITPGITDVCQALSRECAKVGFTLRVKKVPRDGYWSNVWNKAPLHVSYWSMRPSAQDMFEVGYRSSTPWNESAFRSSRFDSLLDQARAELDAGKHHDLMCEMQRLVSDQAGTLISWHRPYNDGISKKVKGIPKIPMGSLGAMEFPEFVWLDA